MCHGRFKGTHYEVGYKWGKLLSKREIKLDHCPTFKLTEERYDFGKQCVEQYKIYFPEILEEIQGIADGNEVPVETLHALLMSMYCFEFENKCTCFAISTEKEIIFARNSDFLVKLEKLYMNCIYNLKGSYSFNGNTTAFVQMEDGINEYGLAVGLTFIYPRIRKAGLNAGILVRYLLEKCQTTKEALDELKRLPIASTQTLTIADKNGDIVVVECNPKKVVLIEPSKGKNFVATTNNFNSLEMQEYKNPDIDDWYSEIRYQTVQTALTNNQKQYSISFAQNVLAGKYGFMCQFDRRKGADTVWSVVYDIKRKQIFRVEGNPSRKKFDSDNRIKFL